MIARLSLRALRRLSRALTISESLLLAGLGVWVLSLACASVAAPPTWWAP